MDYIEKTGRTVEEAVASALAELNITAEEADITVIDQGKPGMFLGLGSKPAKVQVAVKNNASGTMLSGVVAAVMANNEQQNTEETAEETEEGAPAVRREQRKYVINDDAVDKARAFLAEVFNAMHVEAVMEKFVNTEEGSVTIRLHGDDMGILIGKHGQTLDSLQYLTNLVANKGLDERVRIIIDVEDYRDRRVETLTRLARRLADKVRREGERIELEAMNPHERKIIHVALQNDHKVTTFSEGEEPYRHVVIELKK